MSNNDYVEFMDASDRSGMWHYLADCESWHRFEDYLNYPINSEEVDKYFRKDWKADLKIPSSDCRIIIDFSAMLLTDVMTGRQKRIKRIFDIKRSCSCFISAPVHWETFDPKFPYQLIPLTESTFEYQTVANYVKTDGLLDRPVVSITRIQNLDIREIYNRKKIQLERIKGVTDIEERRLFHGTNIENVDSICKYNFDLRLAGKHGSSYGKGIYFARYASYADKYSGDSTDPLPVYGGGPQGLSSGTTRVMFLARVIIGKSVVGCSSFQKPDHGKLENSHDSCVNDAHHPTIFVIFDPNQVYPEYLIWYR